MKLSETRNSAKWQVIQEAKLPTGTLIYLRQRGGKKEFAAHIYSKNGKCVWETSETYKTQAALTKAVVFIIKQFKTVES
jgi:hypothetical protein